MWGDTQDDLRQHKTAKDNETIVWEGILGGDPKIIERSAFTTWPQILRPQFTRKGRRKKSEENLNLWLN